MASIAKLKNGRKRLQLTGKDGARKRVRLGMVSDAVAKKLADNVEALPSGKRLAAFERAVPGAEYVVNQGRAPPAST